MNDVDDTNARDTLRATGTICSDLVVVELGAGSAAGSRAGMFFADNGARVVKVEPPEGDRLRAGLPSGWLVWNRGKESLVADLRTADGREAVRALIAAADVVIEAFESGQAEAFGVGYDDVRSSNPGLVYCSIKGFAPHGPYASIKGYDGVVMAKAGAFNREAWGFRPGPIFSGAQVASNGAAHMAASGILAALVVRDRTGQGQRVDASLFVGLSAYDAFPHTHVQLIERATPAAPEPALGSDTRTPAASRYMLSSCTRDGRWLYFSPQLPHQARALMVALELEELLDDPRFKDMPTFWTLEDADAWETAVHERVRERDLQTWIDRCLATDDLPFEPVLSAEEALDHGQVRANGNVITVVDPELGLVEQVGPVAAFDATPSVIEASAPALGRHGPLPGPKGAAVAGGSLPPHPLAGITIVEFGYFYAMPLGVAIAAALGARVIKVENLDGDPMRWAFGPPEWGAARATEGKESVALNLDTEDGRVIMHELLRRADVFVLGFRPGVAERNGVDYDTVRALNPRIVYVHGAGYGPSGPYANRPIYAGTAGAAMGGAHRQAAAWLDPEFNAALEVSESQAIVAPRMRNLTDGDANAAVAVATATLLGLRHQQRTGEGQFIATSMLGGNAIAYSDDFNRYVGKRPIQQADPEQLGTSAVYRLYQAREGWVFFAVPTQREWQTAVVTAGWSALLDDPRFRAGADRDANDDALTTELETVFAARTAAEWEELFVPVGVGCVAVADKSLAATAMHDDNLRAMGLVDEIEHPLFGPLLRYGLPAVLSETPGRLAPGCTFAQHTAAVLTELGYSDEQIEKLAADSCIGLPT